MQSDNLIHKTDNRNYDYTAWINENRDEYDHIIRFVEPGKRIIDLGCGNGSLMQRLIKEKNSEAVGMEISDSAVQICREKGLNVIPGKIDEPLPFENNAFDYAICNVTVQMVMYPEVLLNEMKRVSEYLIISFPNFAFYKNRMDLLIKGRMPKSQLFGYKWYNTGHIHQLSIKDFTELLNDTGGLKIINSSFVKPGSTLKEIMMKLFPNMFQQISVFLISREQ